MPITGTQFLPVAPSPTLPSQLGSLGWFRPLDKPAGDELIDALQDRVTPYGGSFLSAVPAMDVQP